MNGINRILSEQPRHERHLTSHQSFTIMDDLLARAVTPVASVSHVFREFVCEVIAALVFSRKRVTEDGLTRLFASVFAEPVESVKLFQSANVDRGYLFSFLLKVDALWQVYRDGQNSCARHAGGRVPADAVQSVAYAQSVFGPSSKLYPALQACSLWYGYAAEWKGAVIKRYLRLIWQRSLHVESQSTIKFERSDLFQTGYIIASRAADRFVSDRGVFTGYLARWLINPGNSKYAHALNLAFGPSSHRHVDAKSYTLPLDDAHEVEDASATVPDADGSAKTLTRRLAAWARRDEVARMALLVGGVRSPASDGVAATAE